MRTCYYAITLMLCILTACNKDSLSNTGSDVNDGLTSDAETPSIEAEVSNFSVPVSSAPISLEKIQSGAYSKPNTAYGVITPIDFSINDNNTIDVFWMNNANEKHITRISLDTKKTIEEITIPQKISSEKKFLGYASLGNDTFIIGHSETNSFGQKNAEAWYTAFNKGGQELFSTRIWDVGDQTIPWTKGSPGSAGNASITYNKHDKTIAIYLAHTMSWGDNVRHQAGWFGFLNSTTGEVLKKEDGKIIGRDWYYSHNFDQRCILGSDHKYYALAHGDSYPRALGVSKWSSTKGVEDELVYYKIGGDGVYTNTQTGDLTELSNGNIAITYSTSIDRFQRDLRIAIVSKFASDGPLFTDHTWITKESSSFVGWGSKIIQYDNNHILTGWNTFNNNKGKGSYLTLTDLNGKNQQRLYNYDKTVFYPSQSLQKTTDGKRIVFVSAKDNNLIVHTIGVK